MNVGLEVGADVRQVLLTGYLERSAVFKVPTRTFDAAAEAFLKATGLSNDLWLEFLGHLVDDLLGFDAAPAYDYESYVREQVRLLKTHLTPPPAAPAPGPREVDLSISPEEAEAARSVLGPGKPLEGFDVGFQLACWGVSLDQDTFSVKLVNSEGGPCLTALWQQGPRIVASSKPHYDLSEPFLFPNQNPPTRLTLRAAVQ